MDSFLPLLEWHHTAEGESYLQHLYNVKTSGRKLFGILERPFNTCSLEEVCYKLVFVGKTGIGKTSTINRLSGISSGSGYFETLGIRITDIYWPVKIWEKVILFKLQCWDAGNNSLKKYNHIPLSCAEKADSFVFVFSCSDANSFIELPQLISKFVGHNESQPGCVVIGIRDVARAEVSKSEVKEFEKKYSLHVLTLQSSGCSSPNESVKVAPILNAICEQLWVRDQQYIMSHGVRV